MENNNGDTYSEPDLGQYQPLLDQWRDSLLEQYGASQPSANGSIPQPNIQETAQLTMEIPQNDIQELNYVPGIIQPEPVGLTVRPDEIMYSQDDIQQHTLRREAELQEVLGERLAARHHRIQQSGSHVPNALVTFEGSLRSIELHRSLAAGGLSRPLTPEYIQQQGDEMVIVEVDHRNGDGSSMAIPFFPGLLIRESHPKCAVCDTDMEFNLDQPELDRATQGFGKQWILGLLNFPLRCELPECSHPLMICRACIRTHIETQVASLGKWVPDMINCPWPRCPHRLTHEEVGRFASADVYHNYQDLCTRRTLAKSPDFRWCLREGCGRGGFYENAGLPLRAAASELPCNPCPPGCITCPHCAMAMCYFCQVPWHQGLTCPQFEEQRAEREQVQATVDWEKKHTRVCPGEGCGVRIHVDGGCSQVHCEECATDFCFGCCLIRGSGHAPRCRIQRILDRRRKQGGNNRRQGNNRQQAQTRELSTNRRADIRIREWAQFFQELEVSLNRNTG
ncbi:hypothetical protein EV127DRAFT_502429 [Xylaria flabelliformis]|nr:hypothetical protein EV127DRAFT_502429 [Xylaria flabelliformis]